MQGTEIHQLPIEPTVDIVERKPKKKYPRNISVSEETYQLLTLFKGQQYVDCKGVSRPVWNTTDELVMRVLQECEMHGLRSVASEEKRTASLNQSIVEIQVLEARLAEARRTNPSAWDAAHRDEKTERLVIRPHK